MFVRIRVPVGEPANALLLPQAAIGTDQGRKYVLVVYDQDVVEQRVIDLGPAQPEGLQVVILTKIKSPVLMLRGEFDGNSTNDDLLDFYSQLPNGDRQFVILPQTAHSAGYSTNRHLLWYAMKNFLAAPAPIA